MPLQAMSFSCNKALGATAHEPDEEIHMRIIYALASLRMNNVLSLVYTTHSAITYFSLYMHLAVPQFTVGEPSHKFIRSPYSRSCLRSW